MGKGLFATVISTHLHAVTKPYGDQHLSKMEGRKGSGSADGVHWKVRENLENLTSAKGKDCQGHIDTPTRSNEAVWGPKLDEDTYVHLLTSKYCFDDN